MTSTSPAAPGRAGVVAQAKFLVAGVPARASCSATACVADAHCWQASSRGISADCCRPSCSGSSLVLAMRASADHRHRSRNGPGQLASDQRDRPAADSVVRRGSAAARAVVYRGAGGDGACRRRPGARDGRPAGRRHRQPDPPDRGRKAQRLQRKMEEVLAKPFTASMRDLPADTPAPNSTRARSPTPCSRIRAGAGRQTPRRPVPLRRHRAAPTPIAGCCASRSPSRAAAPRSKRWGPLVVKAATPAVWHGVQPARARPGRAAGGRRAGRAPARHAVRRDAQRLRAQTFSRERNEMAYQARFALGSIVARARRRTPAGRSPSHRPGRPATGSARRCTA